MTHELEKLQRKGTKPTCPHCHATVLSTSQPERMAILDRKQSDDLLRECGYEPKAATPTDYEHGYADGIEWAAVHGAMPAVGEDETENFQRWLVDHLMPSEFSHTYLFKVDENGDYCHSFVLDAWDGWKARAALAATPAVGGEHEELLERLKDRADPYAGSNSDHELIQEAVDEIERLAFLNLCEVLGLQATPLAYLDAVAARAAILAASPLRGREPSFTDETLNAAVSEYYDMSPRSGWSEGQRVGMRKAILTALSSSPPEQSVAADKESDDGR